jgi:hypothetical protein
MRRLETEEQMNSVSAQEYVRHIPSPLSIKDDGSLSAIALSSMRKSFEERAHSPSSSQWEALAQVAETVQRMADGALGRRSVYLSSLDPGVGKTQAIIHSVRALVNLSQYRNVGVIIFLSRLAEIQSIVEEMQLVREQFAVLVANTEANNTLNNMGNQDRNRARVLFTTQQMLESRSNGKKFADVEEFYFRGVARQVRIWDEAILPARPICVDVTLIEAMTNVFRKQQKKLFDEINSFIESIKKANDGEFVEVPDFEDLYDFDSNDIRELFHDEKRVVRDAAIDLWLLLGRTVSIKSEGNNTVLDYNETWPSDLLPILVLDASGRVRKTYRMWNRHIGNLIDLKHAKKDYSKLTVHLWRKGGGKESWKTNANELIDGVVSTIRTLPEKEWLVVHHKYGASFRLDVPSWIKRPLATRESGR